jgi:ketosteroid isomerase-like protein
LSEKNVTRFIAATDAFNRLGSNVESLDEEALSQWLGAMSPEIRFEPQQAALQGAYVGHQGALRWLADLAEHYERGRIEYADIHDAGDRVLGLGAIHIVGRGSGIETDVPAAILMTFQGGLIIRLQDFGGDTERARQVAGLAD